MEIPQQIHAALVNDNLGDHICGHVSRDSTAINGREKPILTLLKQARAFGIGCILSTQNTVDLDL